jgi:uncharacterized small protein (DUF1192 family)
MTDERIASDVGLLRDEIAQLEARLATSAI